MADKTQRKTPAHFFIMGYQIDGVWLVLGPIMLVLLLFIPLGLMFGKDDISKPGLSVVIESQ